MSKVNPAQFIRQVRQEVAKVSWPSRKETGIGTIMVFMMVFLAAIFFFVVDLGLSVGCPANSWLRRLNNGSTMVCGPCPFRF